MIYVVGSWLISVTSRMNACTFWIIFFVKPRIYLFLTFNFKNSINLFNQKSVVIVKLRALHFIFLHNNSKNGKGVVFLLFCFPNYFFLNLISNIDVII